MGCNSDVRVVARPHRDTMVVKKGCRIAWRMVSVLRISLSATSRIHEADFMQGPHVGVMATRPFHCSIYCRVCVARGELEQEQCLGS